MVEFLASLGGNIWTAFAAVVGISAVSTALTQVVKEKVFHVSGTWAVVIAWVVAILTTGVAHLCGFVGQCEPQWLTILLTGIMNGIASSGIYSIPVIKEWLQKWFPKQV